jgi:acetylglutamate synthase
MFMTEILGRCSLLEHRAAHIYTQLANSVPPEAISLKSFWSGLAAEETHHATVLATEKASLEFEGDAGYFLPEYAAKLLSLDDMLKQIEEHASGVIPTDDAFHLALDMEQSELNTIYRDLVTTGRSATKLKARHVDHDLNLPQHQQALVAGATRFLPGSPVAQRAQDWLTQNRLTLR